jgi:tetratricopeptide (TPR) repeat protein
LVLILAVLWGCATQGTGTGRADNTLPVGYRYTPTLSPGLASPEAAKRDLALLLGDREHTPGIKYYGGSAINTLAGEPTMDALLKGARGGIPVFHYAGDDLLFIALASIPVLDDRIEVSSQVVFYFANLADQPIAVETTSEMFTSYRYKEGGSAVGSSERPYKVQFPGRMAFVFAEFPDAKRFADDLLVLQQVGQKQDAERRARFEASVAQYRALTVKPPVSEEQRKVIVQANLLTQRKEYGKAIELYLAALDLDPVSYPAAYFNLALLSAQTEDFTAAIRYMQQYLQLSPDAADARSAQDKIYEWELLLKRN